MRDVERPVEGSGIQLREYVAIVRRRKLSLLAVTALVLVAGLLFSFRQTPTYESEAEVLVKRDAASPTELQLTGGLNLQTEKELAESEAVAEVVAKRVDANDPPALLEGLTVELPLNTEILVFRYVHSSPETAQTLAQSFAKAYLDYRQRQVIDELLTTSSSVQERIDGLNRQLRDVNRQLSQTTDEADTTTLQSEASSIVAEIVLLKQELATLKPPDGLQVGQVVDDANLPSAPASPNHLRNGIFALGAGLLLGVATAFVRERLDDRLRGRDDLETVSGAPILAAIPRIPRWKKNEGPILITITEPASAAAEAFRKLRTAVLFLAAQRGVEVIMVTSPQADEGKTATTANLGVVMAQAGKKVVLVSADLRKPRLHRFFDLENYIGVTNVLAGEVSPWQAVRQTEVENLQVLASGPVPSNPAELLGSQAMGRLLTALREVADFVIVDAPPVMAVADPVTLTPLVDGVLFLADAHNARRGVIEAARRQLDQVDARIIGAVLNNFDAAKAGSYYYYEPSYRYEEPAGESAVEEERPRRLPWRSASK
jgi:succinoglycan biosynthesis transport protein ExoP